MNKEEAIKHLKEIRKGAQDCLEIDESNNIEDAKHWRDEVQAIETVLSELKNSIPKQVILELKEKVHETLEINAMTRFYRIVIEDYFDEILKGEE